MNSININKKILENYKMKLFNELVKLIWTDEIEDINKLPEKVLGEDIFNKFDKGTIINLLRVVMGLNPIQEYDIDLNKTLYEALNLNEISQPIISIISNACTHCEENKINQACLVKDKHNYCNEKNTCSACGACISKCSLGAISDKIQFIPMINLLKDNNSSVYAIVAPSIVGQFGEDVTIGRMRSSLKKIGFRDMIEVAVAADILTVKESYEYYNHMNKKDSGYFITSCCCPVWVNLIQKNYPQILENMSPSVSPMIACARIIKIFEPNSKVVFIGPCIAKKKEATLDDLKDAVDFVLTFTELEEILKALNINPVDMEDDERIESSLSGRIYGKSGGVSKAIELTVKSIDEDIVFKGQSFNGTKNCIDGIEKIINKEIDATFIEGMGCVGGCIGGPKRILTVDEGEKCIDKYSEDTNMITAFDNLNVAQILAFMSIKRTEYLGKKEEKQVTEIFNRNIKGGVDN